MSSFINQFKTLFFSYFVSAIAVSETKEEEKKKKKKIEHFQALFPKKLTKRAERSF
jgi:Na+/alanine symporter